jgi:hypothetical protein
MDSADECAARRGPPTVIAVVNPNDEGSIPPWLVIVLAVAIVGVAVVSFLRRKR